MLLIPLHNAKHIKLNLFKTTPTQKRAPHEGGGGGCGKDDAYHPYYAFTVLYCLMFTIVDVNMHDARKACTKLHIAVQPEYAPSPVGYSR